MGREPKTIHLSLIDSQEDHSSFFVKSLYVHHPEKIKIGIRVRVNEFQRRS